MPRGVKGSGPTSSTNETASELTPEQKAEKAAARHAEKATKFKTLAAKRMTAALGAITVVGNLADKNNYSYTQAQIDQMANAFAERVNTILGMFASNDVKKAGGFHFEDGEPQPETNISEQQDAA